MTVAAGFPLSHARKPPQLVQHKSITMIHSFSSIAAVALFALTNASPTPVQKRADSCGQWDSVKTGTYTVYNNLWGRDAATSGSQCYGVDGLSGSTVSWHTSWSWQGGQYSKHRTLSDIASG